MVFGTFQSDRENIVLFLKCLGNAYLVEESDTVFSEILSKILGSLSDFRRRHSVSQIDALLDKFLNHFGKLFPHQDRSIKGPLFWSRVSSLGTNFATPSLIHKT